MRKIITATLASAMSLAAVPAMAQSVTDADANTMLGVMSTTAFEFCTDSDKGKDLPPIEQYNACQTALSELAQVRAKNPKATAGQREVYAFFEAAVEMGNTYSMLRIDGTPTARVCGNIEKQWRMANSVNSNVVGNELKEAQSSTREAVMPLVKLCREKFAAPSGAPTV